MTIEFAPLIWLLLISGLIQNLTLGTDVSHEEQIIFDVLVFDDVLWVILLLPRSTEIKLDRSFHLREHFMS